jgi:hypothetical protein
MAAEAKLSKQKREREGTKATVCEQAKYKRSFFQQYLGPAACFLACVASSSCSVLAARQRKQAFRGGSLRCAVKQTGFLAPWRKEEQGRKEKTQ